MDLTIHIPSFILWMILGAITIPLGLYLLVGLVTNLIVWWFFKRG